MLELVEQSDGLRGLGPAGYVSRLVPVPALHGSASSHRLLWLLARRAALQGDTVLVLDGCADESGPDGLRSQLNRPPHQPQAPSLGAEVAPGIHIWPARQGLQWLAHSGGSAGSADVAHALLQVVPPGILVLLTAPVEVLAVCLQRSGARPLVAMDAQPREVVACYNAVKVLLQAGDMHPVLVPMSPHSARRRPSDAAAPATLDAAVAALARCAHSHLGEDLQIWPVAYDEQVGAGGDRVPEAWWYKVLDSALATAEPPAWIGMAAGAAPLEVEHRRC